MSADNASPLAAALAAFQAEAPRVAKDKTAKVPTKAGGQYSYSYADLADVAAAAYPLLAKHGLSFCCLPRFGERGYELAGLLLHSGGERLEGVLPLHGSTPQELGSSLTYMRRYLLGAMTGIVTDTDDDGVLAQQARHREERRPRSSWPDTDADGTGDWPEDRPTSGPKLASEAQVKAIWTMAHKVPGLLSDGDDERSSLLDYLTDKCGRLIASSKELTGTEASRVIDALKEQIPK